MIGRLPLRLRVAAAFALASALVLVALGVFAYVGVERTLVDQARAGLETQLAALAEVPQARRDEAVEAMSETYGQLLSRDGEVLASSDSLLGPAVPRILLPQTDGARRSIEHQVALTADDEPENALLLLQRDDEQVLVVGTSREDVSDALQSVLAKLLVGGLVGLLLASALGYQVSGLALRPIERMRRQASVISEHRPAERLPLPEADDELRRLGTTLNDMLDRLDRALQRERRFVAEAGHELRTPLALLRMELDLAQSRPRSPQELLDALRSAGDEVDRLSRLAEDLLLLGSQDAVRAPQQPVDLAALLPRVTARFEALAADSGRSVTLTGGTPGEAVVRGDAARLDRVFTNLVDNALKHGAGPVTVGLETGQDDVAVRIADTGPGPAADAGHGLGLAIVRAAVADHGGRVTLDADASGGTVATVVLPRATSARPSSSRGSVAPR